MKRSNSISAGIIPVRNRERNLNFHHSTYSRRKKDIVSKIEKKIFA
jgi:hypothetical protein